MDSELLEATPPTTVVGPVKKKKKRKTVSTRGVVYIKNIPHGFYEEEMKEYFSQFGKVLKVKVSRSIKTGNSRGYGFIQFADEDVAKVAVETMNNYLMFEKIVKCRLLLPGEVKPSMIPRRPRMPETCFPGQKRQSDSIVSLSSERSKLQMKRAKRRRKHTLKKTISKFSALGINLNCY